MAFDLEYEDVGDTFNKKGFFGGAGAFMKNIGRNMTKGVVGPDRYNRGLEKERNDYAVDEWHDRRTKDALAAQGGLSQIREEEIAKMNAPAPYGFSAPDQRATIYNDARPREGFISDPTLPRYGENAQTPGYGGVPSPQMLYELENERRGGDTTSQSLNQHQGALDRKFGNAHTNEVGTNPTPMGPLPTLTPTADSLAGGGGVDDLDLGALDIPAQSPKPGNVTGNPYQSAQAALKQPWSAQGQGADPQSVVQNTPLPGQAGGNDVFQNRVAQLKQQNQQPQVMAGRPPIQNPQQPTTATSTGNNGDPRRRLFQPHWQQGVKRA
jgi:hypothetical protein